MDDMIKWTESQSFLSYFLVVELTAGSSMMDV